MNQPFWKGQDRLHPEEGLAKHLGLRLTRSRSLRFGIESRYRCLEVPALLRCVFGLPCCGLLCFALASIFNYSLFCGLSNSLIQSFSGIACKLQIKGKKTPAVITGKPINKGGSLGRDTATAQGGFYVLDQLVKKLKLNPKNTKVIIQGFGNAGSNMADILFHSGYRIIGYSDSKTAIIDPIGKGFDSHIIEKIKKKKGYVDICECQQIKCVV